jgi:hypothetical protein
MKFSLKKENKENKKIENVDLSEFSISLENNTENQEFNPWNFVRVVNVSSDTGDKEFIAHSDEKVIIAHRGNKTLGNPFSNISGTMEERFKVISQYQEHLNQDIENKGIIYNMLKEIAQDILENNTKIALACHCFPLPCHASTLIPVIINLVNELQNEKKKKLKI